MRIFDKGNFNNKNTTPCPICKTKNKGKVVLIPIIETQDGNTCEAVQVHLNCLDLVFKRDLNIIVQRINKQEES